MTNESKRPRALRVALVVSGSVIAERTLDEHRAITLGSSAHAALPAPPGVDGDVPFLEPTADGGWELALQPTMRGAVWTAEGRTAVDGSARALKVGAQDYGVLTFGGGAVFFQGVDRTEGLRPGLLFDPNLLASVSLSTFLHIAALVLLFLAQREAPTPSPLELPPDLVRSFLVSTPPEPLEPAETVDAAPRDEGAPAETTGETSEETGERAARARAPARETRATRAPNVGLLRAIQGEDGRGNALAAAMQGPDIAGLLDGIRPGSVRRGPGRGPGLSAVGPGTGERGPLATGPLDTRVGDDDRRPRAPRGPRTRQEHQLRLPPPERVSDPDYPIAAVQRVVRRNRAAIQYCYETVLQRRPDLRGSVAVSWRIRADGRAGDVRVQRSSLREPRVEGCITRQVRRWRFPPATRGAVEVHYPFLFGVAG